MVYPPIAGNLNKIIIATKAFISLAVNTETQVDYISQSCCDRDSSRLKNLEVVEIENHRDWPKVVESLAIH